MAAGPPCHNGTSMPTLLDKGRETLYAFLKELHDCREINRVPSTGSKSASELWYLQWFVSRIEEFGSANWFCYWIWLYKGVIGITNHDKLSRRCRMCYQSAASKSQKLLSKMIVGWCFNYATYIGCRFICWPFKKEGLQDWTSTNNNVSNVIPMGRIDETWSATLESAHLERIIRWWTNLGHATSIDAKDQTSIKHHVVVACFTR